MNSHPNSRGSAAACEARARELRDAPEWCNLSEVDLQSLERAQVRRSYQPGEMLFHEGTPCLGAYFVLEGLVGVRKADPEGNTTLIKLAYPGDTLGYRPFLAEEPHRASAEVLQACAVSFIECAYLRRIIHDNPAVGLAFLSRAAKALGEAEERFHETVTLSMRARFAHLLMVFRERFGEAQSDGTLFLELPVSRGDLAAMLGVRRESISRVIHELQQSGIARFSGQTVHVLRVEQLVEEFRPPVARAANR